MNQQSYLLHRPYVSVSEDDLVWLEQQKPCIQQLWFECTRAEKTGKDFGRLNTKLSKNSFSLAKKALDGYLFEFEPILKPSESGRYMLEGWQVRSLHGCDNETDWWEDEGLINS